MLTEFVNAIDLFDIVFKKLLRRSAEKAIEEKDSFTTKLAVEVAAKGVVGVEGGRWGQI